MRSKCGEYLLSSCVMLLILFPSIGLSQPVDLFPIPVSNATSLFPSVDDDFLEVSFTQGFTFDFYGTTYTSIFLNTNGGFTFGSGSDSYDEAAADIPEPGVAIFWGDMDAAEYGADMRPNQMMYEQFSDRFIISYTQFQDNDDGDWNNTATVTLYSNGAIVVGYGNVLSEDILVGVFDGSHTDDRYEAIQANYPNYQTAYGTGIILFDDFGSGPTHYGELDSQTITFGQPPAPATSIPTLSQWGMMVFALLMAGSALWYIRRGKIRAN